MASRLIEKPQEMEEFKSKQPISDLMGIQITKTASFVMTPEKEGFARVVKSIQKSTLAFANVFDSAESRGKFVQPEIRA